MEQKKVRVALVFEDKEENKNHYDLLLRAFSLPNVLELFTPIIYTPRSFLLNQKKGNGHLNLKVIRHFNEAKEGCINIFTYAFDEQEATNEEGVRLQLYKQTLADYQERAFDVLVSMPSTTPVNELTKAYNMVKTEENAPIFHVYETPYLRVAKQ